MSFDPWVEDQAKKSLELARKHDIKMNLPSDVNLQPRKTAKNSSKKNLKFEVNSTFYVLIIINSDSAGVKYIDKVTIYKDLDNATQEVFHYIKEGFSADNFELQQIGVENNGKVSISSIEWKKIAEKFVKHRSSKKKKSNKPELL